MKPWPCWTKKIFVPTETGRGLVLLANSSSSLVCFWWTLTLEWELNQTCLNKWKWDPEHLRVVPQSYPVPVWGQGLSESHGFRTFDAESHCNILTILLPCSEWKGLTPIQERLLPEKHRPPFVCVSVLITHMHTDLFPISQIISHTLSHMLGKK